MGTFSVRVTLRNWQNRFLPEEKRGEEVVCDAIVDSGAVQLALPIQIVERLRLLPMDKTTVFTADGGSHEYRVVGIVEIEVQGRKCAVQAIEIPRDTRPLLGAVPLEQMDWHIDPVEQRLVGRPESPDKPLLPLV
ncbi:MAG TPA: clan AA aspartic protease [bacterium]|nr:clan AA aspartic protease [bacterium]